MASSLRLGSSALRSSLAKPAVQTAALNGVRCYSAGKAKVCRYSFRLLVVNNPLTLALFCSPSRRPSPTSSLPRLRRSRSSASTSFCLLFSSPPCSAITIKSTMAIANAPFFQRIWLQGCRRSHSRPGLRWCSWNQVPCLGGKKDFLVISSIDCAY